MTEPQIRRKVDALTLHRLRDQDRADTYALLPGLCRSDPVRALMDMVIHFADAAAAALEQEHGSREAAAEFLQQQIYEEHR